MFVADDFEHFGLIVGGIERYDFESIDIRGRFYLGKQRPLDDCVLGLDRRPSVDNPRDDQQHDGCDNVTCSANVFVHCVYQN